MNRINNTVVTSIRTDKQQGLSLNQLSVKYHISKSTASYYCRDLFTHPKRQYLTEHDARHRVTLNAKRYKCRQCGTPIKRQGGLCVTCYKKLHPQNPNPNNHHHKLYPCRQCGEILVRKVDALCLKCYRQAIHEKVVQHSLEVAKQREANRKDREQKQAEYYQRLDKPQSPISPCNNSPTKAHHWILGENNVGVCKYCHAVKDMSLQNHIAKTEPKAAAPTPTTTATALPKPIMPTVRHKLPLQERYVRAMCKVPYSLIGFNGFTEKDARFVCSMLKQNPPTRKVTLKLVLSLEKETADLQEVPNDFISGMTNTIVVFSGGVYD